MGKYRICENCHIAFDRNLDVCPSCGRAIVNESERANRSKESNGRKYGTGGEACNYCPHCYGNADWCPIMDD